MTLDTNAVSAILGGDAAIAGVLGSAATHHLPIIVIAEYQFGIHGSRYRAKLETAFARLESHSIVLPCERETANWYAAIRHDLRRRGRPIPENDLWIAALARQHSLEVVSRDPHFDQVEQLRRVGW